MEEMYCIIDPKGRENLAFLRYFRKTVETDFLKNWENKNWKEWYRHGWRIKKVRVTIKR